MKNALTEIYKCEVCDNTKLLSVLNLGLHPMCDDLVAFGESRECKEYPIEILFCPVCKTAHQKYQIPKNELFPKNYHYRSRFTADVLEGMETLVYDTKKFVSNLNGKKIIDIGCNDGSLLDFFKKEGAVTFGIEPTGACQDAKEKGHEVYKEFLTTETAKNIVSIHGKFDIITFTNVFAHIEDLKSVINSLKELKNDETIIIIENHYLGAVLDKNQFDTFYHEHPRTYSFKSFEYIASSLGMDLINTEFPSRYGGNIRVMMGNKKVLGNGNEVDGKIIETENSFVEKFIEMNNFIQNWKVNKKKEIKSLVLDNGPLLAKAFPGRAAILVKLLNLDSSDIASVYEKPGSMKIGHYLPGTRIPIVSDDELFLEKNLNKPLLNNAWHISNEIKKYLINNGFRGKIIDII